MLAACERAVQASHQDLSFFRLEGGAFAEAPALSIDHAVMEHTSRAAVVPVDMAWSDVGSWHALREIGRRDTNGNVFRGDVIAERVHNSYIRSEGQLVAAIGVDNIVVVATDDAVLVAGADRRAQVSGLVDDPTPAEAKRARSACRRLPAMGQLSHRRRRRAASR